MNPWIPRLILLGLAAIFLPALINGITHLTADAVDALSRGVQDMLSPLSRTGRSRTEGVIKLCLYLIAATLVVKYLLRRRK